MVTIAKHLFYSSMNFQTNDLLININWNLHINNFTVLFPSSLFCHYKLSKRKKYIYIKEFTGLTEQWIKNILQNYDIPPWDYGLLAKT